jgi:hypothetical protein
MLMTLEFTTGRRRFLQSCKKLHWFQANKKSIARYFLDDAQLLIRRGAGEYRWKLLMLSNDVASQNGTGSTRNLLLSSMRMIQ